MVIPPLVVTYRASVSGGATECAGSCSQGTLGRAGDRAASAVGSEAHNGVRWVGGHVERTRVGEGEIVGEQHLHAWPQRSGAPVGVDRDGDELLDLARELVHDHRPNP